MEMVRDRPLPSRLGVTGSHLRATAVQMPVTSDWRRPIFRKRAGMSLWDYEGALSLAYAKKCNICNEVCQSVRVATFGYNDFSGNALEFYSLLQRNNLLTLAGGESDQETRSATVRIFSSHRTPMGFDHDLRDGKAEA